MACAFVAFVDVASQASVFFGYKMLRVPSNEINVYTSTIAVDRRLRKVKVRIRLISRFWNKLRAEMERLSGCDKYLRLKKNLTSHGAHTRSQKT